MSKPKLAVGYPWSSPFSHTAFTDHLPNLERPEGWDVRFFRGQGWSPARRHVHICEQALNWGADVICIIGSDQVHPEDMLPRLIKRMTHDHCEVITALVPTRGYVGWQNMKPFQPLAWRFKISSVPTIKQFNGLQLNPEMIEVIDPKDGDLQRVNFIGSGVLMFQKDHLLALPAPWFSEMVDHASQNRIANMDCRFVWRLQKEAHAKVWVDTTIKVKHLHVFHIDETFQTRFDDWMEPDKGDPAICRYQPLTTAPGDPAVKVA